VLGAEARGHHDQCRYSATDAVCRLVEANKLPATEIDPEGVIGGLDDFADHASAPEHHRVSAATCFKMKQEADKVRDSVGLGAFGDRSGAVDEALQRALEQEAG